MELAVARMETYEPNPGAARMSPSNRRLGLAVNG